MAPNYCIDWKLPQFRIPLWAMSLLWWGVKFRKFWRFASYTLSAHGCVLVNISSIETAQSWSIIQEKQFCYLSIVWWLWNLKTVWQWHISLSILQCQQSCLFSHTLLIFLSTRSCQHLCWGDRSIKAKGLLISFFWIQTDWGSENRKLVDD